MSKPSDDKDMRKKSAQRRGRLAETLVGLVLRLTGHRILARNLKTPVGEIDIVARRGAVLAFVEVKARDRREDAAHALGARQRDRIARAAQLFLAKNPDLAGLSVRFDVALVGGLLGLSYLKNAWRPE